MSPDLSEEDDQSAFSSKLEDQMKLALTNGFIDTNRGSESSLSPRLIANREGYAFGDIIQDEISSSTDFEISVAFVTSEAIYKLRQSFIDFYSHYRQSQTVDPQHSHGLLITSTYNYFNSPQVFQELLKLKRDQHIDVRVWQGTPINDQSVLKLKLGRNYDVPYHLKDMHSLILVVRIARSFVRFCRKFQSNFAGFVDQSRVEFESIIHGSRRSDPSN